VSKALKALMFAISPRPNIRVTRRHLDYLSGKRVVMSNSKRPQGLTCSHVSGAWADAVAQITADAELLGLAA